jgi:SdrD B-like domain/Secretion system C-terminal sorting domain
MKKNLLLLTVVFLTGTAVTLAQSGRVFQDFNGNGLQDAGEQGVGGINVKSYMPNGSLKGTAVSDSLGNYSLVPASTAGQKVRMEFSIPGSMSYFKPAFKGNIHGSSVRFINGAPSNVNYAVVNSKKHIKPSSDPILIHSRYTFGDQVNGQFQDTCVLFGFRNSWGVGASASDGYFNTWHTHSPYRIASAKEIGSVYGVVYSPKRNMIYTSAFFRQFNGFGPGGPGAIYKIPYNMTTGSRTAAPSTLVNVTSLAGQSMPADPHGTDIPVNWSAYPVSSDVRMALVSKYSLGDMEISEDESKLFTVNLYNREIVTINPDNGALISRWAIPTSGLTNSLGAVNSNDVRPFGLGYKNGKLYVGAIATGQSTQTNNGTAAGAAGNDNALHAYVWSVNETTGAFTLVLDFKIKNATAGCYTWQDSWANGVRLIDPYSSTITMAQPILSDIDFYGNDMIVGFRNRANDQWAVNINDPVSGGSAYTEKWGDILGARFVHATGKYIVESAGTIGSRTATGTPGTHGAYNEFYRGDGATIPGWDYAFEDATGAFVQMGGANLVSLQNFPSFSLHQWPDGDHGGVNWISNETGAATKGYASFLGDLFNCPAGKSNGMGAIESVTSSTPIEIGNRVWNDENGNGIQDADEGAYAGVIVEIYNAAGTVLLGTDTTNADGDYLFDFTNVTGELQPNTTYKLRITASQFSGSGGIGVLAGMVITPAGETSTGEPGVSDNDAILVAGRAEITYTTGNAGENNHDLDFGLKSAGFLSIANITQFTAVKNKETTNLQWTTVYEEDLAYFEIERSTDGARWQPLGRVTARGNSSSPVNYTYNDQLPVKGKVNLYRLRQVGNDAKVHYSEIRSVRFNGEEGSISIFPNPATNRFVINMPEGFDGNAVSVKIINTTGQAVKQMILPRAARQEAINCDGIPAGAYRVIVGMNGGDNRVFNTPLQVIR